jgi:hypothetical protein
MIFFSTPKQKNEADDATSRHLLSIVNQRGRESKKNPRKIDGTRSFMGLNAPRCKEVE